jgi:hypothetical protein
LSFGNVLVYYSNGMKSIGWQNLSPSYFGIETWNDDVISSRSITAIVRRVYPGSEHLFDATHSLLLHVKEKKKYLKCCGGFVVHSRCNLTKLFLFFCCRLKWAPTIRRGTSIISVCPQSDSWTTWQSEGQGNGCSTPAAAASPPWFVSFLEKNTESSTFWWKNKERGATSLMADGLRWGAYKFEYF